MHQQWILEWLQGPLTMTCQAYSSPVGPAWPSSCVCPFQGFHVLSMEVVVLIQELCP